MQLQRTIFQLNHPGIAGGIYLLALQRSPFMTHLKADSSTQRATIAHSAPLLVLVRVKKQNNRVPKNFHL